VRQDDSDDDSSSSSSSGNDDESSSSDDNDSLDAAHAAAVGHSPQAVSHRGALNPRTPVGATAAVAAGLQTSIVKDHTTLVSDHQLLNGDTAKQPPTTEIDTNIIHDEEMGDSQNGVETKKDSTEAESPAHERAGTSRDDKGISLQAAYSSRDIKKSPPLDAEKNSSAVDINPVNDTSEAGVAPESNETMKLEIPKEEITMSAPKQGDDKTQQRPKKKRKKKLKKKKEPSYYCPYDLNERDEDENTPLHVAIHSRKLEHVRLLLEAGASIHRKCDGSFPIHVAISIGAIPAHASFAYECVKLLQEHGADFFTKDDSMHSPLYLACVTNQVRLVSLFLADTGGMGTLNVRCDRVGGRVLHAAARFDDNSRAIARPSGTHKRLTTDDLQPHVPTASLTNMNQSQGSEAEGVEKQEEIQPLDTSALITQILLAVPEIEVDPQNNYGRTPLHVATMRGNWPVVRQLLHAGANPDAIDRRGYKPGGLAHKRGMVIPNDLLPVLENSPPSGNGSTPRDLIIDPAGSTLLLCHELCSRHKTCPPIARGTGIASSEPPPENVRRLHVLINEDVGILRCSEFDGCSWETEARRAAISDILRVSNKKLFRLNRSCFTEAFPSFNQAKLQLEPRLDVIFHSSIFICFVTMYRYTNIVMWRE
jgi:ankyrin repeat protein